MEVAINIAERNCISNQINVLMSRWSVVVLFIIAMDANNAFGKCSNNKIIVSTDLGKIEGATLQTRLKKDFYAFRGIRYATPPIGDLRFKPPVPVKPWTDIFDATIDGPRCPQPTDDLADVSEDCLRINVYTPKLPTSSNSSERYPVVVYLHPGGFYGVSGQSKNFAGPTTIMDYNIVFVTLNYRLGSLGFMSTGTKDVPGNAGLKDQVMALKWIQSHIDRFGGDPNSVTLMGYSAGAMSITLHMISPMSKDLFHKAIVMSAAVTGQWEVPSAQIELAKRQARLLNCSDENIDDMLKCLNTKNAVDFGTSLHSMFDFGFNPVLLWTPVVEPDFGQERFLAENPTKAYQEGRFMKIPVIVGITKDEFAQSAIAVLKNETMRKEMEENFEELAPKCFLYERGTDRSKNITKVLRREYLKDQPLDLKESLEKLSELFSDGLINFGVHRFTNLVSRFTDTYSYRFSYQGRYSHVYYPDDKPYGVVHHDDLVYLLDGPYIAPMFTEDYPEHITGERLCRMWTKFAKDGNPNGLNDEYVSDLNWTKFNEENEAYLDIGEELIMKKGLYKDRFKIWEELFPLENN